MLDLRGGFCHRDPQPALHGWGGECPEPPQPGRRPEGQCGRLAQPLVGLPCREGRMPLGGCLLPMVPVTQRQQPLSLLPAGKDSKGTDSEQLRLLVKEAMRKKSWPSELHQRGGGRHKTKQNKTK
jgi:hypothetical protein